MFFFEKKNQKIFIRLAHTSIAGQMVESLFASFSTEKEDSSVISAT